MRRASGLEHLGVLGGRRRDRVPVVPLGLGEVLLLHLRAVVGVQVHLIGAATRRVERDRLAGLEEHDHLGRALAGVARGALLENRAGGAVLDDADTAAEPARAPDEQETTIAVVASGDHEDGALLLRLDDAELALGERRQSGLQVGGRRPVRGALGLRLLLRVVLRLRRLGRRLVRTDVQAGLAVVGRDRVLRHRGHVLHRQELAIPLVPTVDQVGPIGRERVGTELPRVGQDDVLHCLSSILARGS